MDLQWKIRLVERMIQFKPDATIADYFKIVDQEENNFSRENINSNESTGRFGTADGANGTNDGSTIRLFPEQKRAICKNVAKKVNGFRKRPTGITEAAKAKRVQSRPAQGHH